MVHTPETFVVPIAAGVQSPLPITGRVCTILSIVGAVSVEASFDGQQWGVFYPGIGYPSPDRFNQVSLWNRAAIPITVTLCVSELPLTYSDSRPAASPLAMNQLPQTLVAATGAPGTLLFLANPARQEISLTARETNGGIIYLGDAAANCTAADNLDILLPAGNWYSHIYKGPVFAVGDDAFEQVGGYEC